MFDIIKVIILGIVEGITEFLPISSTGHLILVHRFFTLQPESFSNAFDVIIQLGAILAVVVLFFNKLNPFDTRKDFFEKKDTLRLWAKVIIGVIPAIILGILFDDIIDKYLFNHITVSIMLVLWGINIILLERRKKTKPIYKSANELSYKTAFFIGCFQCLAMIPGTSRSAVTIFGAILLGSSKVTAAEFSFFLAIPTMLGATALKVFKLGFTFTPFQWILIFIGAVVSFVVALLVIRKFMDFIKKHSFTIFGWYRILLGAIVLISSFLLKK